MGPPAPPGAAADTTSTSTSTEAPGTAASPAALSVDTPAASGPPTVMDSLIDRLRQPAAAAAAAAVWLQRGMASWYGGRFHGRPTASGERFDMHAFSAAHKTLPLRSYARVRNPANGREVVVRVNDRGPFHPQRIIDLSMAAARHLGLHGVAAVEVEHLGDAPPDTVPPGTAAPNPVAGPAGPAVPAVRRAVRPAPAAPPRSAGCCR